MSKHPPAPFRTVYRDRYKARYENELARANRNACAFRILARAVDHASKMASALHHEMERDSFGNGYPRYLALAITAVKQAANDAYMTAIREHVE